MVSRNIFLLAAILTTLVLSGCVSVVDKDEAAAAYFNLGNAYFELDKYDEAVKAYARAIELDSSFERASYNLARLYLETNRVDEGIAVLEDLEKEDEGNSIILNTLAYAHTLNGDENTALTIYNKVLRRSPNDKNALYNASILLWNKGELEEARSSFHSLYEIDSRDKVVLYYLGLLEIELENREAGIRYLEYYLEQESTDTEALIILGDAYRDEQYYGDALEAYNKVTAAGDADPELYFKEGYILLTAIGDTEKGLETLEQAIAGGYKEEEQYWRLSDDPELVDREKVRQFLLEKGLLRDESKVSEEAELSETEE